MMKSSILILSAILLFSFSPGHAYVSDDCLADPWVQADTDPAPQDKLPETKDDYSPPPAPAPPPPPKPDSEPKPL